MMADLQPIPETLEEHEPGFHPDGRPTLDYLSNAIQVWALAQNRALVTVGEAALAFNLPPSRIAEAVEWHYWMFLSGAGDLHLQAIEHEGE